MFTLIIFILILGLLVLVHEFGHFITARKSGMKVYEFGFGFPPRAFGVYKDPETGKFVWVWGKGKSSLKKTVSGTENKEDFGFPSTIYSFNWLPLGGFVRIKGENGEDANEPDSFGYQKAWKRIVVLVSGVTMNIVLAGVLLSFGFMVGLPTDLSAGKDDSAIIVQEPQVLVQMISKDSPAEIAGIKFGDMILQIDETKIVSSEQMVGYVRENNDRDLNVVVNRNGEELSFSVRPEIVKNGEANARLGVMLVDATIIRYPWYIALYKGFIAAFWGFINIFVTFYYLIKYLILGQGLVYDVSGPVGIAKIVGDSARLGISYLINITAMLSLSLAVINILPIPALDGGRILFILIEKIIRRPVPMKYEQIAHMVGFVLLMVLIVVVTARDVVGLF
ncbi:RIP metalloprotease RseP [Patescibacteria group bacterium]|nr:RIP metalloprotease RseP [Patescibacteria group bacterium]